MVDVLVLNADGENTLVLSDTANFEFKSNIARLQRQMFALLPKYCLSDNLFKQVNCSVLLLVYCLLIEILSSPNDF